jgi:hypothetical protein
VEVGRPPKAAECKGLQNGRKREHFKFKKSDFVLKKFKITDPNKRKLNKLILFFLIHNLQLIAPDTVPVNLFQKCPKSDYWANPR